MSAYRVGIIGLGSIGMRMLAAIDEHPDFEAAVAFDPSASATVRAVGQNGQLRVVESANDIARADDVDLVYIACPPDQHAPYALAAKDAGKAVLCEKPLGIDLDSSRELVERMADGPPHAVNFLLAAMRGADRIVDAHVSGELGDLVALDIRFHLPAWAAKRYAQAPWLAENAAGGFVREVVSHHVYFASRLLGRLELCHARVKRPSVAGAAEHFAAALLFGGGVPVTVVGATRGSGPDINECIVRGTRASYRIRNLHWLDIAGDQGWRDAYAPPAHPERDTHLRQLDRVKRMLAGEPDVTASFADALHVQEHIEAIVAAD